MNNPSGHVRSPFKFLDPYGYQDNHIFFGRAEEVERLYQSVNKNRLVLVYGPSGTGKTSLVQCGLANRFEVTDWMPFFIRRGRDINQSLYQTLSASRALAGATVSEGNLLEALERISTRYVRPVYLIFDQFEELLILGNASERHRFIQTVEAILNSAQTQSCYLLFILREEYFAWLDIFEMRIPGFSNRRLRVERMRPAQIEEVILNSCAAFNIDLEAGRENARQIIRNLQSKGGIHLPYLQVYLDMLWQDDYRRTYPEGFPEEGYPRLLLTTSEIDHLGVIRDVLERFLSERTIAIQLALNEQYGAALEPDIVAQVLDAFVTDEGTKRPVSFHSREDRIELDDNAPPILRNLPVPVLTDCLHELERNRLLRSDGEQLELAHDILAALIDQRRSDEQRRLNRLRRLVRSNYELDQPLTAGHLAEIGDDLARLALEPEEAAFVEESRRLREAERQAEVNAERRKRRRATLFAILGIALAVISLVFFLKAQVQEKEAIRQREEADRQRDSATLARNAAFEARLIAEEEAEEAERQKGIAEQEKDRAERAAERASKASVLAEVEAKNARAARDEAEQARASLELTNEELAQTNSKLEVTNAELAVKRAEAEQARSIVRQGQIAELSRRVALQSRRLVDQDTLQAMLARTAYLLYRDSSGAASNDPEIFSALYESYKNLKGADFNSLLNRQPLRSPSHPAIDQLLPGPAGRRLYLSGSAGAVKALELTGYSSKVDTPGNYQVRFFEAPDFYRRSLALSTDGARLAVGGRYPEVLLYETANSVSVWSAIDVAAGALMLAFTDNGGLYVVDDNASLFRFALRNNGTAERRNLPSALAIALRGQRIQRMLASGDDLVLALQSGRLLIWRAAGEYVLPVQPAPPGTITALAAFPERGSSVYRIAAGTDKGALHLFTFRGDQLLRDTLYAHHRSRVAALAFSPGGNQIALAAYDRRASVISLGQGEVFFLEDFDDWVTGVAMPEANVLITGDRSGRIRFFSLNPADYLKGIEQLLENKKLDTDDWNKYFGDVRLIEAYR